MKVSLITPVDIKYSYKATEYAVYEYAKFLHEHGINSEILITKTNKEYTELPNYKKIIQPYKKISRLEVRCKEYLLPFKWHLFVYRDLPKDGVIYLPYSIYDYIINIARKPKGQKYIIGCHGMHLKRGNMVKDHQVLEALLNSLVKLILFIRRSEMKNLYCHALNKEQEEYMIRIFKLKKENVFRIPIMVDAEKYRIATNKSKRLKVVHIGGHKKNLEVILEIILDLKKGGNLDKFEFYFIGKTNKKEEMYVKGIKNVHFLGPINETEKVKLLSNMDAMIVPAYEAFPKTLIEGLVSDLCILTSKRNSAWEDYIELGIRLTLTENGTADEYINPLLKIAAQKHKKKSFNLYKEKNRKIAIMNFDLKSVLPKIMEMFIKVAK